MSVSAEPSAVTKQAALFAEAITGIGNTPLREIATPPGHGRIFAKCEWENPGGAIKDRVAMAMMRDLLERGLDPERDVVLEYSGGQLAMSLAAICQTLGVRLVLVLGGFTPQDDLDRLAAMGAEVRLSAKEDGFWGVMQLAFKIAEENPSWKFLYQHTNEANLRIHADMTAGEILEQLPIDRLDAWVAAIGTGGTLVGTGRGLRRRYPDLRLVGVTPAEMPFGTCQAPYAVRMFAGSGGLGNGRKQPFVAAPDAGVDEHVHYTYAESKAEMARFFNQEGIKIGSSAAACLLAARGLAERGGPDSVIGVAFASAGAPSEWRAVEEEEGLVRDA